MLLSGIHTQLESTEIWWEINPKGDGSRHVREMPLLMGMLMV